MDAADKLQGLCAGQPVEEREVFGHDADLALDGHGIGKRVETENPAAPTGRLQQSGEALDGRGLARAVRAEKPVETPARHMKVDAVDGDQIPEHTAQPARLERKIAHGQAVPGVAVHGVGRESRQADGDVLGTAGLGRAVADPLARPRHDRLPRADVDDAGLVLDADHAAEHDGDLLEVGALSRLDPAVGRRHLRHTHARVTGVHAAGKLLDALRFVARRLDDGGSSDQMRQCEGPRR